VPSTDRPSGPVPQGAPPTGGPPPDGGPSPAGPSPSGHPTASADDRALLVDDSVQSAEDALESDFRQLARERDEYRELAQRIQADFENYKKRILKQQTEHLERAAEGLVEKLLPALDTVDLALAHGGEGLDQVQGQLMAALEKEGLERIEPKGSAFDPAEAEAVMHEPGQGGEQVVAEVLRPGYRWRGQVLRPAMVKVTD
jgi:molecular chaperone GrpE